MTPREPPVLDIEHLPVEDDPREWSALRKNTVLLLVSLGATISGFSANIQNPAIADMEKDLPATSSQISLTLSLFIISQGGVPFIWAAISEIKGRKMVYLISLSIYVLAGIAVALSRNIAMLIVFRIIQGAGSSAVMTSGGATLADVFDPHERGTKMGIYYLAQLLGPSLAPLLGGALTDVFNWRATFWFLVILGGTTLLSFALFFKDTFRKERSLIYQNLLMERMKEQEPVQQQEEEKRKQKAVEVEGQKDSQQVYDSEKAGQSSRARMTEEVDRDKQKVQETEQEEDQKKENVHVSDVEKGKQPIQAQILQDADIKLSLHDVNPVRPVIHLLKRKNNFAALLASGIIFGYVFVVLYGTSRTLDSVYGYPPVKIGLVLFSFGIGQMSGSLLGGRWSDYVLARYQRRLESGTVPPETRLRSITYATILFPMVVVGFGWASKEHVHIAVICVLFFFSGFGAAWVYVSNLAYTVDSNVGRSAIAMSLNSGFRGIFAFIGTEVTVPIQDSIGDGWMYTIFAIILWLVGVLLMVLLKKGEDWRLSGEEREKERVSEPPRQ